MELYKENGEKAGLYDVCKWWIETYPADIFIHKPEPIIEARMCMQNILVMQNKKEDDGLPPTDESVGIRPTIL